MQMSKKIYHNKAIWSKKKENHYIVAERTECVSAADDVCHITGWNFKECNTERIDSLEQVDIIAVQSIVVIKKSNNRHDQHQPF